MKNRNGTYSNFDGTYWWPQPRRQNYVWVIEEKTTKKWHGVFTTREEARRNCDFTEEFDIKKVFTK